MVDPVRPAETFGWRRTKPQKSRECKIRKEVVENRETADLSVMVKYQTRRLSFITEESNNLQGLGFHGIKLSKM